MMWLLLCLCVCVTVANELQCHHPDCKNSKSYPNIYFVNERRVKIYNRVGNYDALFINGLYINCEGSNILDSPALPRYKNEISASNIVLMDCPLPSGNNTLASVFSALNIKLEQEDGELFLSLVHLPKEPKITARHFQGLENLTLIGIDALQYNATAEPAFLSGLANLQSVSLHGLNIIKNDLQNIPKSVEWFDCTEKQFYKTLPETISETLKALPGLKDLSIEVDAMRDYHYTVSLKSQLDLLKKRRNKRTEGSISVVANSWYEVQLKVFEQCDQRIESIELHYAKAEELPNRWVAACTGLKKLHLHTLYLTKLPAKVLDGATELTYLKIDALLESIPDGWLQGAPKLHEIDLTYNNIKTLSSGSFSHASSLQILRMNNNQLENTALGGFSVLTFLRTLELAKNKFTGDICLDKDYEPLRSLAQLTSLDLSKNDAKKCYNWKQSYPHLENLSARQML